MLGDASERRLAMRAEDLRGGDAGVGEEAIGAVGLGPAAAGAGDAGGGLGGEAVEDELLPAVELGGAQVERRQLLIDPIGPAGGSRSGTGRGPGPPRGPRRNPFPYKDITILVPHRIALVRPRSYMRIYSVYCTG